MFRWTACDPLIEQVIEKGKIPREEVLAAFLAFPWGPMLAKMQGAREEDVHFPPSVGFTNLDDAHALEIVMVDDDEGAVFYLFYDDSADESYRLELLDQTPEVTTEILTEFVDGDYARVRAHFEADDEPASPKPKPWWKLW